MPSPAPRNSTMPRERVTPCTSVWACSYQFHAFTAVYRSKILSCRNLSHQANTLALTLKPCETY